jgi:toxin HigB-1
MILLKDFKHRGLKELFETGSSAKVAPSLQQRALVRLDAMAAATDLAQLNQPGFNFHALKGKPLRYSIHVNGPWCITFGWTSPYAQGIDLENYH